MFVDSGWRKVFFPIWIITCFQRIPKSSHEKILKGAEQWPGIHLNVFFLHIWNEGLNSSKGKPLLSISTAIAMFTIPHTTRSYSDGWSSWIGGAPWGRRVLARPRFWSQQWHAHHAWYHRSWYFVLISRLHRTHCHLSDRVLHCCDWQLSAADSR